MLQFADIEFFGSPGFQEYFPCFLCYLAFPHDVGECFFIFTVITIRYSLGRVDVVRLVFPEVRFDSVFGLSLGRIPYVCPF